MSPIEIDIVHNISDRVYNLTVMELKKINQMFNTTIKEFQSTIKDMMAIFNKAIKELSSKIDKLQK
ncbi:hypothetical protein LCGC14_1239090 [marine sediment metagenome]|uniref:Uncharacterized protein n=1 Tax=marine sediment metagenome TaxID=412755 RepID=A0A0F9NNL5_9ZZZZ